MKEVVKELQAWAAMAAVVLFFAGIAGLFWFLSRIRFCF